MMYQFPRLSDPKEFERLVRDYCNEKYGEDYSLYGHSGQKQYGIDIISCDGVTHGQAKNYSVDKKDIDAILGKYEKEPKKKFIIATNSDRDTKIQDYVLQKQKEYKISIVILFWDDFEELLSNDAELYRKYYPKFKPEDLLDSFEDLIDKYHISEICDGDPTIGTIPVVWWNNLDYFVIECTELLRLNIRNQKKKKYVKINEFKELIEGYFVHLGIHFDFPGGRFMYLIKGHEFDMEAFKKETNDRRLAIIKLYHEITGKYLTLGDIHE